MEQRQDKWLQKTMSCAKVLVRYPFFQAKAVRLMFLQVQVDEFNDNFTLWSSTILQDFPFSSPEEYLEIQDTF